MNHHLELTTPTATCVQRDTTARKETCNPDPARMELTMTSSVLNTRDSVNLVLKITLMTRSVEINASSAVTLKRRIKVATRVAAPD